MDVVYMNGWYDLHLSKLWVNIIMANKKLLLTWKKCLLFENCYWTQQEGSPQKGYEKFSHHLAFTKTSSNDNIRSYVSLDFSKEIILW